MTLHMCNAYKCMHDRHDTHESYRILLSEGTSNPLMCEGPNACRMECELEGENHNASRVSFSVNSLEMLQKGSTNRWWIGPPQAEFKFRARMCRMSCRSLLMDALNCTNRFILCSCLVLASASVVWSQVQAAAVDDWACNTAKHLTSPCSTSEEQCYTKCVCRADEGWSKAAGPWQGGYCNSNDDCICCNAQGNAGDERLPSGKVITCI